MRFGWKHRLGRIAALLGVLGLLVSGTTSAVARAQVGQIDAGAAPAQSAHATSMNHHHKLHDRGTAPVQPSAELIDDADRETSSPDCPHHHARACCTAAVCPAFNMALTADPLGCLACIGAASSYRRYAMTVPAGVDASLTTPPPRRDV